MPPYLCEGCVTVVTEFYNFTVVYEHSTARLKKILIRQQIQTEKITELCADDYKNPCQTIEKNNSRGYTTKEEPERKVIVEKIPDSIPIKEDIKSEEVNVENDVDICEDSTTDVFPCTTDLKKSELEGNKRQKKNFKYVKEQIKKYECKECGDSFLYTIGIISHMSKTHGLNDIDCEKYSVKTFRKVKKPVSHEAQDCPLDAMDIPPSAHQCQMCKIEFPDNATLKTHLNIHKRHICEVCGHGFLKRSYLIDHQAVHQTEKNFKCKFCDKTFRTRTVLVAHKRRHIHPGRCVCDHCGKRFNDNSTLKTHILLLHTKERNFKCVICGLTFPLKSTLEKHVQRHLTRETGEQKFPCDKCHMRYKDKSSLDRHKLVKHSGLDVRAKCEYCEKSYTTTTKLVRHRKLHHPDAKTKEKQKC